MEEITIRFEIVRLAVKIADHETISVQAIKLREISLDEDLNEIIALLESRNYRQGLSLMKGYMNSLEDSFFDPVPTPEPPKPKAKQEPQNLFDISSQENKTINLDDMLRMTEESASTTITYAQAEKVSETYMTKAKEEVKKNEAFLDIHKHRVENKTMIPDTAHQEEPEEALYNPLSEAVEIHQSSIDGDIDPIAEESSEDEDTPSNIEEVSESSNEESTEDPTIQEVPIELLEENNRSDELTIETEETILDLEPHDTSEEILEDEIVDTLETHDESLSKSDISLEVVDDSKEILSTEEAIVQEVDIALDKPDEESEEITNKAHYEKDNRRYPPISYIDQKFRNMRHQFPQVEAISEITDDVKMLLKLMATKGYTENDIKETIVEFQKKKNTGENAEAAQLLLLAAASESEYAQLLLARELFKGEVLVADYPESFTQINRLAEHDYPEAICDLAQLYEYGYGIKKDKKTAILLYQEAAQMGIERAQKHVERLTSKKGLLGLFKR